MTPTLNNSPTPGSASALLPPLPDRRSAPPAPPSAPQQSAFGGGAPAIQAAMSQVLQGLQALSRMVPSAVPFFAETVARLSQIVPSPEAMGAVASQGPPMSGPPQGAPPDMNASNPLPMPPGA